MMAAPAGHEPRLAEAARQLADGAALQRRQQHADIEKDPSDLLGPPAEAAIGPEREGGLHAGKGADGDEEEKNEPPEHRALERAHHERHPAGALLHLALLGRAAFLESRRSDGKGDRGEERREECRSREIGACRIRARQKPADRRADREAEAERRADHAHALGAFLGRGHVGDVGLGRRDVAGAGARQKPRREQHP